ncbi:MAG: hypothetical protein FWE18_02185 [Alphaproteobacteria bacterium]|nr:hypothetical protein [Alphaproteobacteria bacterium]
MRIFALIILVVSLTSALQAQDGRGFYVGGTIGYIYKGDIKISNINSAKTFQQNVSQHNEYKFTTPGCSSCFVEIINDYQSVDTYNSVLKGINFKQENTPAFALTGGFAFKNIRIEGEVKTTFLKTKPKSSLYDISLNSNYINTTQSFCNAPGYPTICSPNNGVWVETTINGTQDNTFNNILIDTSSGAAFFSPEVNKELFDTKPVNANNYLGFMNLLYELPLAQSFTIFTGVGLGYGMAAIGGNNAFSAQQITYPAYQYKMGAYYSFNNNMDITLNYSNINMIGTYKTLSDNNFQSVDIGIRYNIFKRSPTFYDDYNYKKIFLLPATVR